MKNKIGFYMVVIIGTLTCLSFIPHAFMGMKALNEHIQNGEILEPAAKGMQKIWLYSSITMLLTGIWLLFLAKPFKLGEKLARIQVFIIGFGLSFFGAACTFIQGQLDSMIGFTVQGLILIIASIFFFKHKNNG